MADRTRHSTVYCFETIEPLFRFTVRALTRIRTELNYVCL